MGVNVEINFEFPDWASSVKAALPEIRLFTAAQIQTNRGMMFDKEGADNGKPKWAPLKFRSGQILSDRGHLRKSWAPTPARGVPGTNGIVEFSGETITVGTTVLYAALMNDGTAPMPGGVLRARNAKALKIPLPSGLGATPSGKAARKAEGQFMFRKSVRIPARRMDEWTIQDSDELQEAIANKIMEVMAR